MHEPWGERKKGVARYICATVHWQIVLSLICFLAPEDIKQNVWYQWHILCIPQREDCLWPRFWLTCHMGSHMQKWRGGGRGGALPQCRKSHPAGPRRRSDKFLDRFESYFGSQISSESLNEVHIYRSSRNPQRKLIFFIYFCLWLIVSSWRHAGLQMARRSRRSATMSHGLVKQSTAIKKTWKMYGKNCNLRTLSREYDCLAKISTKDRSGVHVVTGRKPR